MRISDDLKSKIIAGIDPFVSNISANLYLFGSRVDDTLLGGDIDLALLVFDKQIFEKISRDSYKILANIKMQLDEDERIDLLVTTPERMARDPFQKKAMQHAVLLFSWK